MAVLIQEFDRVINERGRAGRPGDVAMYRMKNLIDETRQDHQDSEGEV